MDLGFNVISALAVETTMLATELAVLALFPAIRQVIGEITDTNVYDGHSAGRRFDYVVYANLAAVFVGLLSILVCCGALIGISWIKQCWVIWTLIATSLSFALLSLVLAVVVSLQFVRR